MNYLNKFNLKGKTAVVTGGAGLIGKELCLALINAEAKVIMADVHARPDVGIFEKLDFSDLNNLSSAIDHIWKKHGPIHIWINSAYPRSEGWGKKGDDLKIESWGENVNMHLNSYCLSSYFISEKMKQNAIKGSILNLGSIYGVVGNDFSIYEKSEVKVTGIYSAIKGGIVNFSRYLASLYGPYEIRINVLCPGGVFNDQEEYFVKNYSKRVPLRRMGNPEEIASAALFLISDAASYVTGATIMVDGGWTAI